MNKNRTVVIFSGGQDSTTCLWWAMSRFPQVIALTFDYGQRHAIEIKAARRITELARVPHIMIPIPNVLRSTSPLVSSSELETYRSYADMDALIGDRVEKTFVPMRNALFLTIGANIAVANQAGSLVTGVCASDNANYPDCRRSFIDAQEATVNEALGITDFEIHTPLVNLDKAGIVRLAGDLGAQEAIALSHTCYAGVEGGCGECHSCVLRHEGFAQAGVIDPMRVLHGKS